MSCKGDEEKCTLSLSVILHEKVEFAHLTLFQSRLSHKLDSKKAKSKEFISEWQKNKG